MKQLFKKILFLILILSSLFGFSQGKKSFCAFDIYKSKYELSLNEDAKLLTYKKYDSDGNLVQTLNGTYQLQDEGVYGPALKVVASINGNTLKWLVIRDGGGQVQELRDESAGRVWSPCKSQEFIIENKKSQVETQNSSLIEGSGSSRNKTFVPSQIIGKTTKIGKIEIAQNDFSWQMDLDEAIKTCEQLGNGWRLPTKDELNIIFKNKSTIKGFIKQKYTNEYWSSEKYSERGEFWWIQDMINGKVTYMEKDGGWISVRAVRTL
jgi:hypothetical protein